MIHAAPPFSRRRFASALGTALGAAALRPSLAGGGAAAGRRRSSST